MPAKQAARQPVPRPPVPEDAIAAVFARAAELDLRQSPDTPPAQLDEESLVEVGAAVGLSPASVRRAVAEHHAGALVRASSPPTTWVGPRLAVAERRVDGDAVSLRRRVEHQLGQQWFRKVRDHGERSLWCARSDLKARVGRKVDLRHRVTLRGVTAVALTTVDCGGEGVAVRLEADPAEQRDELRWTVAGAAAAVGAAGAVAALVIANVDVDGMALAALPSAGLGGGTGLRVARRRYLDRLDRLTDELEGILDRVEPPRR